MSRVLITYDLKEIPDDIHYDVKQTMIEEYGYSDKSPKKKYQLPNTCLLKDGITKKQAVSDLKNVVDRFNGTLERYLACKCDDYAINDLI